MVTKLRLPVCGCCSPSITYFLTSITYCQAFQLQPHKGQCKSLTVISITVAAGHNIVERKFQQTAEKISAGIVTRPLSFSIHFKTNIRLNCLGIFKVWQNMIFISCLNHVGLSIKIPIMMSMTRFLELSYRISVHKSVHIFQKVMMAYGQLAWEWDKQTFTRADL